MIVWELKRPKISLFDKLPEEISKSWEKYNFIQDYKYAFKTKKDTFEEMLLSNKIDEGKKICIKNFMKVLRGDAFELKGSTYKGFVLNIEN